MDSHLRILKCPCSSGGLASSNLLKYTKDEEKMLERMAQRVEKSLLKRCLVDDRLESNLP
jgi:hypothetical protein